MTFIQMQKNCFAVIFTSVRNEGDNGYAAMAEKMERLAQQQKGFLGMDSARSAVGITVSYWETEADILAWKQQTEHLLAQTLGKEEWYQSYQVSVCKVLRHYEFDAED